MNLQLVNLQEKRMQEADASTELGRINLGDTSLTLSSASLGRLDYLIPKKYVVFLLDYSGSMGTLILNRDSENSIPGIDEINMEGLKCFIRRRETEW